MLIIILFWILTPVYEDHSKVHLHGMYVHVCIILFEFSSTHGLQAQLHGSECDMYSTSQ